MLQLVCQTLGCVDEAIDCAALRHATHAAARAKRLTPQTMPSFPLDLPACLR
jgi:hypothetical protein